MSHASRVGASIRALRIRAGMRQKDVGVALGREPGTVYRWESGSTEPSLSEIEKLAELFGVTPGQIVDGVELGEAIA